MCRGPAELTVGGCWRALAQPSDGVEPQQTQRIGLLQDLAAGDLAQQSSLESSGNDQEGATTCLSVQSQEQAVDYLVQL